MGRKAEIFNNGVLTGALEKTDSQEFIFRYDEEYCNELGRTHLPHLALAR